MNETEILGLLEQQNFTKVVLTGKTIREQARLCYDAEVVIGAHGAGFTNLAFCAKGTKVLEFIPPAWSVPAYFNLCAVAELNHSYIMGTALEEKDPRTRFSDASFHVDLTAVTDFLKMNGLYKDSPDASGAVS